MEAWGEAVVPWGWLWLSPAWGKWWPRIILSFPLLCFHVELDVLGSFFCIAVLLECSETDLGKVPVFSLGLERQKRKERPKLCSYWDLPWAWRVRPELGADTAFWSSAPLSQTAALGTGYTCKFSGFILLLLLQFEFGQSLWLKLSYFNRILSTHLFV